MSRILRIYKGFNKYLKINDNNNKLFIKKEKENQMSLELIVEYLFKKNNIKIDLKPTKINYESIVKDMFKQLSSVNEKLKIIENNYTELKNENNFLKEENKKIKEENRNIKEENKKIGEENNNIKEENK